MSDDVTHSRRPCLCLETVSSSTNELYLSDTSAFEKPSLFSRRNSPKYTHPPLLSGGGGVLMVMHAVVIRPLTSHPYKARTEHAGISPDQARTQLPSAKRRGVFDALHER